MGFWHYHYFSKFSKLNAKSNISTLSLSEKFELALWEVRIKKKQMEKRLKRKSKVEENDEENGPGPERVKKIKLQIRIFGIWLGI